MLRTPDIRLHTLTGTAALKPVVSPPTSPSAHTLFTESWDGTTGAPQDRPAKQSLEMRGFAAGLAPNTEHTAREESWLVFRMQVEGRPGRKLEQKTRCVRNEVRPLCSGDVAGQAVQGVSMGPCGAHHALKHI